MECEQSSRVTLAFAEAMHESFYGFRPTEAVHSFREQMLHIAQSINAFVGSITAMVPPVDGFAISEASRAKVLDILNKQYRYGYQAVEQMDVNDLTRRFTLVDGLPPFSVWDC